VTGFSGAGLEDSFRRAVERAAPVFGHSGLDAGDGTWIGFDYAILPLSEDGARVDKCLAIEIADAVQLSIPADDHAGLTLDPDR
jgi:hypothetical protein